ncbi:CLUMA_CG016574, isoform A [Clunio marinus]|uniref:CLUMA_CG016574, isoform A n=1 Tax=Clunio marinus TaxID=568069 RepID=A0A1J1ISJ0_9DIPT|nr:CLUMA_CG016574, isoform A [Clunio marinus]
MEETMSENRKEISKVIYNDRYGYAIAYYPRMRDPGLEIIERSKKIVLPKTRKIKPEPTRQWKLRETPSEFVERKNQEREIEMLHDTYEKAKDLFKKARDYDYNRHEMLFPKYKNVVHGRTVDETIEKVNKLYEKNLKKSRPVYEDENESIDEVKPASVITDIHRSCEHKITKRREDAIADVKSYCDSIEKIHKRIQMLSKAYEEEEKSENCDDDC